MPNNLYLNLIPLAFGALILVCLLFRLAANCLAPVKTVKAVVSDKNVIQGFSKYSGNGKSEKYVIVFTADGKKKSFYVSQFSYDGYRIGEKGKLTYKGDKLISFQ